MSSAQRRFGPFNIGIFGLLASIVNGINLIIIQSFFVMSSYSFIMFLGPLIFLLLLLLMFSMIVPLFIIDIFYIYFLLFVLSSILIFVYFLLSYASFSKYSIIGSFRIIIQFLSFGLIFDCVLCLFLYIFSFLSLNLVGLYIFQSFLMSNVYIMFFTPFIKHTRAQLIALLNSISHVSSSFCFRLSFISFSHSMHYRRHPLIIPFAIFFVILLGILFNDSLLAQPLYAWLVLHKPPFLDSSLILAPLLFFNDSLTAVLHFFTLISYFPIFIFVVFNMCILVECNRLPFDIPEAESELVAGFMTEFSSLYFSIIILNEYFSLIIFSLFLVLLLNLYISLSLLLLFF